MSDTGNPPPIDDDDGEPRRGAEETERDDPDRPRIDLTGALGHTAGETLHATDHEDTAPVLDGGEGEAS